MTNSAAYVARVGGIAVAFGIGAAVATGQEVAAWADTPNAPSQPGGGSESSESSAGSADSAAGATATADAPAVVTPTTPTVDAASGSPTSVSLATPSTGTDGQSGSQSTMDLGAGVVISSSGGAHTSTTDTAGATPSPSPQVPVEPTVVPTGEPAAELERSTESASGHGNSSHSSPKPVTTGLPSVATSLTAQSIEAARTVEPARVSSASMPSPAAVQDVPAEVMTTPTGAAAVDQTAVPASQNLVQTVLAAVLAPFSSSGTGDVPTQSPLMWTLLAVARGQFKFQTASLSADNLLRTYADTGQDADTMASALALSATEQPTLVSTGAVGTGASPSGVAVSGGKAYVTNATSGTMTVINLADNSVLATVPVGVSPTAVVVNSAGTRAYITNSTAGTVTVINTTNNTLVKTITVGANPSSLALTPSGDRLFVTNSGAGTVTKINTTTNTVTVAGIRVGNGPSSVAITSDGKYAYVTNSASDSVSVITLSTNFVSKTIAGVGDSPTDVVLDAGRAYVSNLDGSVAIISTVTNTITGRVNMGTPVKSLAMTPDGGLLIAASTNDTVAAIDTAASTVVSTLTTDPTPDAASSPTLAVAANGTIYQTDNTDNVLRILNVVTTPIPNDPPETGDPIVGTPDPETGEVTGTIVASDPDGDDLTYTATTAPVHGTVSVEADGSFTYTPRLRDRLLADEDTTDSFVVTVSDGRATATSEVTVSVLPADIVAGDSVTTGGTPSGLAVSGNKAYVTNASDGTMTVINLADHSVLATVPVGVSPTAVVVNSAGTRAYVTNSTAGTVTVINTSNNTLVATVAVGANPSSLALSPDGARLFVTNAGSGTVTKINTTTNKVTVNIGVGNAPSSIAITSDNKYAYVTNSASDSVSVITVSTNGVKTIAGVGDSPTDVALGVSKAYVSNLDGTVAVITTSSNTITGRVTVGGPVKSLALTPDGGLLMVARTDDTVAAIDTATSTVVSTLVTDPTPDTVSSPNLAVAANGTIYQTDSTDNRLRQLIINGFVPSASQFERIEVVSGLSVPVDFRFLPGGRMLVVEKGGAIKVASSNGVVQSTPLITLPTISTNARGLIAVELDPNYQTNGYIYVAYTPPDNIQQLSRLTVTDPTASVLTINPASEVVLVKGTQPAANDHMGGGLSFGPDGKLYWSTGDNVCCSVIDGSNSQDLSNMYGKVLRLNPDGTAPADNPFYDGAGPNYDAIYATGFRNPFRLTFTPDGKLLVGEVGQATWEEINLVTRGANYGWPFAEGPCNGIGVSSCATPSSYTNPIHAYLHTPPPGNSIGAVLVYDGSAFGPAWKNTLFFADFSHRWIKTVTCTNGFTSCGNEQMFMSNVGGTTRLAVGPDGNIYQLTLDGKLSRIAPVSG